MPPKSYSRSCRICLNNTKYSDIVSFDNDEGLLKMYEFCFGLNLSVQDKPRTLCGLCVKKMKEFADFKILSQNSDRLWKTIVNINPTELTKNYENPSLDSIKQEFQDVYNDTSDTEADNLFAENYVNESLKEEETDCGYEKYISSKENADDSDESSDNNYKSKKKYTCERCKMEYKFQKCYKSHLKRNNCMYKETYIAKPKPNKKAKESQEFHCGLCTMQSTDPEEIDAHLNEHSTKDDLSCQLCEFIGRDFADMETHRYSHHPKTGSKIFRCHVCNKRSIALLALQFHYRTVHLKKEKGGVCTVCSKEFRVYKIWRNHERWHKAAKYICDICDRKFLFRNGIISHLADHAEIKPFICDICGRGFKRNRNLTSHLNTVHDTLKVTCTHCNKVFKNKKCLEMHTRLIAKKKQYQCEVCSKCFHTMHAMRMHMPWHSNDRPYSCDLCSATYKIKPQLRLHMRIHTGFNPYRCLLCPKEFPTSKQLKVHSSVHSGLRKYRCDYCERSFHNKKDLILHCDKAHHVTDVRLSMPKKESES